MKGQLISQFIDNELDLDEKLDFIRQVSGDEAFRDESLALVAQEQLLRSPLMERAPRVVAPRRRRFGRAWPGRGGALAAVAVSGALAAALVMMLWVTPAGDQGPGVQRFVIYQPAASRAQIVGSFTDWQRVPLNPIGESGYWEARLPVTPGEHRYAFIIGEDTRMADPTVPVRERDDFGGFNSILQVEAAL